MPTKIFNAHYVLRGQVGEQPFTEYRKCTVKATNYADAFDEGWEQLTHTIQSERYNQVDFAGLTWMADSHSLQDCLNAQYSSSYTIQNLYAEDNLRGWDGNIAKDDYYEQPFLVDSRAKEMREDTKLYSPNCFLAIPWAERAAAYLEQEGAPEVAAEFRQLAKNVKEGKTPPKVMDEPYHKQLLTLIYADKDKSGYFPPQKWSLNDDLLLCRYKQFQGDDKVRFIDNAHLYYNPEIIEKSKQYSELIYEKLEYVSGNFRWVRKIDELRKLVEETRDKRLFSKCVGLATFLGGEEGKKIDRIIIENSGPIKSHWIQYLYYHYGKVRDEEMLQKLVEKDASPQDEDFRDLRVGALYSLHNCMKNNDIITADYLMRYLKITLPEFEWSIERDVGDSDSYDRFDNFMTRLETYLIHHYGQTRDENMLKEIYEQAGAQYKSSNLAMEQCMREGDFATAGYLLRHKAANFDDFARHIETRKKKGEDFSICEDFLARLQKYNKEVVLPSLNRTSEPSLGREM